MNIFWAIMNVTPTAATAPLSLASVKISSSIEALVEFASQETRAIQGVVAISRFASH